MGDVLRPFSEAPKGFQWKRVLSLVPGDRVLRWGDLVVVVDTHLDRLQITIDCQDGSQIKSWSYKLDDELLVKEENYAD